MNPRSRLRGAVATIGLGLMITFGLAFAGACSCYVEDDAALARFRELAGTNNVEIVRTNRSTFKSSHDVTYELRIDGKPAGGRCTDGYTSELVCRIYYGLDGGE